MDTVQVDFAEINKDWDKTSLIITLIFITYLVGLLRQLL